MWLISLLALLLQTGETDSPIKRDEDVVFFPTFGHRPEGGTAWSFTVHGWIYEPEAESLVRRVLLDQLRRSLGIEAQDAETAIFKKRARAFLVDNERGKAIPIRLGSLIHPAGVSAPNGHFKGNLQLSLDQANELKSGQGWINYRAVTRAGDDREFVGRVQLIGETGLSVISDIDDTIKISEVSNRKALLANTFLKEFQAVSGMADVYRGWSREGAVFHYVSASPWQLYSSLSAFLQENGFPEGTFHLKDFRWKDSSFFNLFESPEQTKRQAIEPILTAFPRRQFILVGDSGEKDPEIYGELARRHPTQISRILIRELAAEAPDSDRYAKAFKDVPRDRWKLFRDPNGIEDH